MMVVMDVWVVRCRGQCRAESGPLLAVARTRESPINATACQVHTTWTLGTRIYKTSLQLEEYFGGASGSWVKFPLTAPRLNQFLLSL